MHSLHKLTDTSPRKRKFKRVGRGPGSGLGKTSGRGQKGQGARSGYKRRYGKEGGQFPLYMKLPVRGFSRARFQKNDICAINLDQIEKIFKEGEEVSIESLKKHGYASNKMRYVKILANGTLSKKVSIKAHYYSASAENKLQESKISFEKLEQAS